MAVTFWDAFRGLPPEHQLGFAFALFVAFAFEFINGFHDTANAVTTVIYTRTLRPTPAVLFSGACNFLGVLLGGTAVAFSIVNLLPVDLLIESASTRAIVMVVSLLLSGVIWNLGTWWMGLPVSSSHTLIGSILGVGLANSVLSRGDLSGVNWAKAGEVGLSLLISPVIGFTSAAALLLLMKRFLTDPRLYQPPGEGDEPPRWVRLVLLLTCGGVSMAHGSNDGQKGMGLILLALIGFLPAYYALDLNHPDQARRVVQAAASLRTELEARQALAPGLAEEIDAVQERLAGKANLAEVEPHQRWEVRRSIFRLRRDLAALPLDGQTRAALQPALKQLGHAIEYVPYWVVLGVALALGIGTTIGYQRIVVTVAEKIGKTHLTYAQGAAAEVVAAATISLADAFHLPVSTTHVLSSGVAGTMYANKSGLQGDTVRKIGLAWAFTLPAAILLAAGLFTLGGLIIPGASSSAPPAAAPAARAVTTGLVDGSALVPTEPVTTGATPER